MSDEIERGIRDWIERHDRPIPVGDAIEGGSPAAWPERMLLPVAIAACVVLVLGAAVVLAGPGSSGQEVETAGPDTSTTTPSAPVTVSSSTTLVTTTTSPTTSATGQTTTTSTTRPRREHPLPGPPTATPGGGAPSPGCEDLESSFAWVETGDAGELVAGAGSIAEYEETTTNRGDDTCVDGGPPCVGPGLLESDGTPRDRFESVACAGIGMSRELAPGETRTDRIRVTLDAPPGRYLVDARLSDGSRAQVSIRLEDRTPQCPLDGVELRQNGQIPNGSAFSLEAATGEFGLVLEPLPTGCTIRVTGVVVEIETEGVTEVYRDPDRHWFEVQGDRTVALPQVRLGPITAPPASDEVHPARVTMEMEGRSVAFDGEVLVR